MVENEPSGDLETIEKPSIRSRGIPSKLSFYLPAHYSDELRSFQDDKENPTRNLWNLDELLNFVFPKKFQPTYCGVASAFMKFLCEKERVEGAEISQFVSSQGISKATFYNRVLPRLKRVGMIKVERVLSSAGNAKSRAMIITISKTFGNYLMKIGDSWLAIVDDVRSRKK